VCNFVAIFGALFGFVGTITMTIISIERYLVVKYPLKAYEPNKLGAFGNRPTNSIKRPQIFTFSILCIFYQGTVCGTWVFGGFWCALPLLTPHPYVTHGFKTSCSFDYYTQSSTISSTIITTTFTFGFVLPLAIAIIFYILIFMHLREKEKQRQSGFNPGPLKINQPMVNPSNRLMSSADRLKQIQKEIVDHGLARNSCLTIFMFSLVWLPYGILTLMSQFSPNRAKYVTPRSMVIATMVAKSSAVLNPIVHGLSNEKLRHHMKKELFRLFRVKQAEANPGAI
jgi:hypothetical protein